MARSCYLFFFVQETSYCLNHFGEKIYTKASREENFFLTCEEKFFLTCDGFFHTLSLIKGCEEKKVRM